MNGRFNPPLGGFLHFLRPGTTKLPLLPERARRSAASGAAGSTSRSTRRTSSFLLRALVAPEITPALLWPSVVLIPLLGITRQDALPRRARRALLGGARLPRRRRRRRRSGSPACKARLVRDLVLGRDLEAQPPLPVGDHGDDEQRAVLPDVAEEAALRRPTPTTCAASPLAASMAHVGTVTEYCDPVRAAARSHEPARHRARCSS